MKGRTRNRAITAGKRRYPGPEAVEAFSQRLKEYKTSKGTIQLPYSKPVPVELISDIARWCYETGNHP